MGDRRLPLSGLEVMDLHAAQERLRLAQQAERRAVREVDAAKGALRLLESQFGLLTTLHDRAPSERRI